MTKKLGWGAALCCSLFACGGTTASDTVADAGSDAGTLIGAADDCDAGTVGVASDSPSANALVTGNGAVRVVTGTAHEFIGIDTTLVVPAKPPASGTLFLWPGVQPIPSGANYDTLSNGVLQPVLTWGPTCAPNSPASAPYASWWISAQYVNTVITSSSPNFSSYSGCHGGQGMNVAVGDSLHLVMNRRAGSTFWDQTVTDTTTGASVSYAIDMLGQEQSFGEWVIEEPAPTPQAPVGDVVFTSTKVTFASGQAAACQPAQRGANDYFAAPRISRDGTNCCISRIILRAQGVAATTPNQP
jgi:hypothetical protein